MGATRFRLYGLLGVILGTVFVVDLMLPLGVAAGVPYVIAVLVSQRGPGWRLTVAVAAAGTLLTVVGYFASAASGIHWMVVANRGLAIGVIWIAAYLLILRKRAAQALEETGHRLETVFATVPDGVIVIDENGIVESFNPAAEKLFGYDKEEIIGRNVSMIMPPPHGRDHDSYLARYLETGDKRIIGIGREVVGLRKDGTHFPVRLAVGEMALDGARAFTGILHDLTEFKNVEKDSLHDAATGLPNRRAFDKYLASSLSRDQTSLLLVDVDNLKSINDELGHIRGDEAIATAAQKIASSLRTTDPGTCARIGSDEFAVVLPHAGDDVALLIANRIITAANPALQTIHAHAGVSVGVACAPKDSAPEDLLRQADEALYRAKATRGVASR